LRHLGYLLEKPELADEDATFIRSVAARDAFLPSLSSSELRSAYEPTA
jgi:hypothetical protein